MGMFVAAGIQAHQELPFYPQQTAWPRRVNIAEREARWMRPELSKVLSPLGKTQLPASARGFEVTIDRNLVRRRGGAGPAALLRQRPSIYSVIVDSASMFFINFDAEEPSLMIKEHGLGSVPCANADCIGEHGKWNTKPLGYHTRRAPCILIGPDGMPSPMVAMRSR